MGEETKKKTTLTANEVFAAALLKAEQLHKGVPYGGDGLDVFYQVNRCAEIALSQTKDIQLATLALLHKSQEPKKIKDGVPLSYEEIKNLGGDKLVDLVKALNPTLPVTDKAAWAKTLPPLAQQMLLIEKIVNFETSRDHPSPAWTPDEHAEYIHSRMQVVEACKDSNPALYTLACKTRDEALQAINAISAAEADATSTQKSWGDKFKKQMFNKTTYVGINYFVNATGSAILGYIFKQKFETNFRNFSESMGTKFGKTEQSQKKIGGGVYGWIEGILLTTVGNLLVPVIKELEDHRQRVKFKMGHMLDVMQTKFGHANSATKQNLADYEKISRILRGDQKATMTAEEQNRFKEKYHLNLNSSGKLAFKERKLPWHKIIPARIGGWLAANLTSAGLRVSDKSVNESLRYKTYENRIAPKLGGLLSKVPGFTSLVAKPTQFGELLIQDAIMSASSSSTHKLVQGMLHKPLKEDELRAKPKSHKAIIAEGPKDMQAHAERNYPEPSLSVH